MTLKMKYKRTIYLLFAIAFPMLSFAGTDVQKLFEKGNQEYARAKYTEALSDYQQVLKSGYQSAALYFNIGNAYYRTDEIPSALLYYEKAHRLAPGDEDINFNIRLTNLKTTDKIDEVPELFINRWWRNFILALPLGTIAALSILLAFLASLLLIWYLFTQSVIIKKTSFFTAIGVYILTFVIIFMGNRQSAYFKSHHQAIIFTGTVIVKSSPVGAAKNLFTLHEGTKVDVVETSNKRLRIKLANGTQGWISAADVKEI